MPLPNFDYDTAQQDFQRRQQLLDALQGSSLQPMQTPTAGGMAAPISSMEGIAKLAQAFMARNGREKLNEDRQALADRYKTELRSGMEQYMNTMQGNPGQVVDTPADGMGPPQVEGFAKPDPRKAMLDAIASNHPVLQQLGMSQLSQLGKDQLTAKDILTLNGFDPKSKIAAALAHNAGLLAPETKEHVVNNQIFAGGADTGYKPVVDARDKFGPIGTIGTDGDGKVIVGQTNLGTGEAKFAPGGGTTVNIDTGKKEESEFAKNMGKNRADNLQKSYENAIAASKALAAMGDAQADLEAGIKSGATANVSLALAKVGKSLGLPGSDDPSIANTEAFRANMARETLNLVKGLGSGTGISNADRDFAEKASGGSIALDDASMLRLLNIAKAAAGNVMLEHNRLLHTNANAGGADPASLATYDVPWSMKPGDSVELDPKLGRFVVKGPAPTKAATAASQAPMSLDAYLKSKGH